MNLFYLIATTVSDKPFFYENWFFVKPFIWLFGQIMNGIMWVLDQVGVYSIALCIVLFTIITKMVLIPFTIKQQKTSRLQAYISPELQAIQKKYAGKVDNISRQKMLEEQQAVQEKYGVSAFSGCGPMLIQMPILFALYPVIYRMHTYAKYLDTIEAKLSTDQIEKMWMLLGINLQEAPGWRLSWALLIPILVAVTQFLQTKLLTSRNQQNQSQENGMAAMKTMNMIMPLMLGLMAVSFPAFLGWYWLIQSLVMAIQQYFINKKLDKQPIEDMIKENVEKANKKRAKKGLPPIGEKATISTRKISSPITDRAAVESSMSQEEKDKRLQEAKEYYEKRAANPGSLAAKANMVRDYNERNKK